MKRHRKPLTLISAINITNLLDIAFVLLICFMLVAPTLKHGLKMDLPEVEGTALELKKKNFSIVIKEKLPEEDEPRVYLENEIVSVNELKDKLQAQYVKNPEIEVVIECDRSVPYDIFARILGTVKSAGITNIGLVTEPIKKKSEK